MSGTNVSDESREALTIDDRARGIDVYRARGLTEDELARGHRFAQRPRDVTPAVPCACTRCDDVCMTVLPGLWTYLEPFPLCAACSVARVGEGCHRA